MTDARIIVGRRRYVAAQQAKIHVQREFIRLLESHCGDVEIVFLERQVLNQMIRACVEFGV
jgi:hypothetical protein